MNKSDIDIIISLYDMIDLECVEKSHNQCKDSDIVIPDESDNTVLNYVICTIVLIHKIYYVDCKSCLYFVHY